MASRGLSINGLVDSIMSCLVAKRHIAIATMTPRNSIFDFDRLYHESGDRYHEGSDTLHQYQNIDSTYYDLLTNVLSKQPYTCFSPGVSSPNHV